eukprot:SAG31_NODE_1749_length_7358_cov_6.713872_7_plen_59_part_00
MALPPVAGAGARRSRRGRKQRQRLQRHRTAAARAFEQLGECKQNIWGAQAKDLWKQKI